ncbi:MAG TPA: hypothetical protein VH144_00110 [Candidatus Saccharimonadales bacterium]|jgi:Tfp pilus assembly protein PilN|nr:hypothetical protein [Candidatus Saccharimonadales bacterium]
MIQLNLLPDIKKEFIRAQRARNTVISSSILTVIVAVGVTVLAFLYVVFGQQLQFVLVNNDITSQSNKLKGISDLGKYLTIQNQLSALPTLHNNKTIYSRLFDYLPTLNPSAPNSMTLSSLQIDETQQTVLFTGTSQTFEALNVFKDTLQNAEISYQNSGDMTKTKLFSKVIVEAATLGRTNNALLVNFSVRATYDPNAFASTSTNVTINVPNIQTTQSVLQSPKPVFNSSGGSQ